MPAIASLEILQFKFGQLTAYCCDKLDVKVFFCLVLEYNVVDFENLQIWKSAQGSFVQTKCGEID
jgi:hypothetical protein